VTSALDAAAVAQLGVPRRRENFPLAFLCPPRVRAARAAVYGYCRLVDDLGDEFAGDRLAALDAAEMEVRAAVRGTATHPVFVALQPVFAAGMPVDPFVRLLDANRWDQRVGSYASWSEVDAYCALSAAPVGEMVLRLEGMATEARLALSASVCAGLQLANHWQDLHEDAQRGRCYVPLPVLQRHGVTVAALAAGEAGAGFVPMLAECLAEARARLRAGWPLVASLRGRMRAEIAGFAAHGAAACDAVERAGAGGLMARPSAGMAGRAAAVMTALRAVVVPGPLPGSLGHAERGGAGRRRGGR
jgi:squalene synthase HpnC